MDESYRGYSISVQDRGLYFRVYVSPTAPWDPILHSNHFDHKCSREKFFAEVRAQIDKLLDYGLRKQGGAG